MVLLSAYFSSQRKYSVVLYRNHFGGGNGDKIREHWNV
jgi:hypothetical protein